MTIDNRLRDAFGDLPPSDPTGALDHVIAKRARRRLLRKVRAAGLAVAVLAGTSLGAYGLARVFQSQDRGTPVATDTTTSPTPQGSTNLAGVGAVCDLSQVSGDLLGNSTQGTAYVYSLPASGTCPEIGLVPAPGYFIGIDLGTGAVSVTFGPIDCRPQCVRMEAAAIAHMGGGTIPDIALRAAGADPVGVITLYAVVPGGSSSSTTIQPLVVAAPGDPPYLLPGRAAFPWGGNTSEIFGAFCTMERGTHELVPWKATLGADGQPKSLHETVVSVAGTRLDVLRTQDLPVSSYQELPSGQSELCGASI